MNKITNHQLYRLIVAHFTEIIREPAVLFWGIVFPIMMAWGLGIAFTHKGDVVQKVAIVHYSDTTITKQESFLFSFLKKNTQKKGNQFEAELKNKKLGNVKLIFLECKWQDAYSMLKNGTVTLIIEDHVDDMKYHFDPASPEAQVLYQLLTRMFNNGIDFYSARQEEIEPLTISGTRYIDFLIPGLISMGIMMSCTWGISYTMIDRRSKKLLRRMVATPMKKSNFLIALMTVRFAMNLVEAALLFLFAWLYFHIQIQGNIAALAAIFIAGNIAFSGIAILISSHTSSTEVGNGLINAIVTPMMVVSGVFFSYHNFPDWSLPVIQKLPLTMLADSVRSIFNEAAGFAEVWKEIFILSATGIISFIVGLKIFKWY
jgi:ABC-2 type transport system permease protein